MELLNSKFTPKSAEYLLKFALEDKDKWDRLEDFRSALVGKLYAEYAEKLLKSALENKDKWDRLEDFRSVLVKNLDDDSAEKLLKSALENKDKWDRLEDFRSVLVKNLDDDSAENLLESALENKDKWDRLQEFCSDLVKNLDAEYAEKLLESALGDNAKWDRLQEFCSDLVKNLDAEYAEDLLKFALEDKDKWDRLQEFCSDLVKNLDAEYAEDLLKFALEDKDKWDRLKDLHRDLVKKLDARYAEDLLKFALEDKDKWDQLENFRDKLLGRLKSFSAGKLLKFALEDKDKWDQLEKFRSDLIEKLNAKSARDLLDSALENKDKWDQLEKFRSDLVKKLDADSAEYLLEVALWDGAKWDRLKEFRSDLVKKLDAEYAGKLLKFAVGDGAKWDRLKEFRDELLGRLKSFSAGKLLKFALEDKDKWDQLEKFRSDLIEKLNAKSAKDLLRSALENKDKWDRLEDLHSVLVKKLDADSAEYLLEVALWDGAKWDRLKDLHSDLVKKLNAKYAKDLLKFALVDEERWKRLLECGTELLNTLVKNLNAEYAADLLESALVDNVMWARLEKFRSDLIEKLNARYAGSLLEFASDNDKRQGRLLECGTKLLNALAGKLDATAAESLLEIASDEDEISCWLERCGVDFLNTLVGKLGNDTSISVVEGKLGFNENSEVSNESKSLINTIDTIDIADVYGRAFPLYTEDYPPYEKIKVIHNEELKLWIDLTTEQQFGLLKAGARGSWINGVKTNYQKYLKLKENSSLSEEEIKKEMELEMRKMIGVSQPSIDQKQHGPAHMLRAALLVTRIAQLYKQFFEEFQNITDEEIKLAIFAALLHDSGRQGEEVDIYDALSALNALTILKAMGLSDDQCERCAKAIENKDRDVADKDIVAILLHEADCLEIQRIMLGNAKGFDSKFLDKSHLTFAAGIAKENVEAKIKDLIEESKTFITNTYGKSSFSYEEFNEEFLKLNTKNEKETKRILQNTYVAKFQKLGICKDAAQLKKLTRLIKRLCRKFPQMLPKIFDNCQWLSDSKRVQNEFIYSFAFESMKMELAEIFDKKTCDANPNGLDPRSDLLVSSKSNTSTDVFSDKNVLDSTFRNYQNYLNKNENLPHAKENSPSATHRSMWSNWTRDADMSGIRMAVETGILSLEAKHLSTPDKNKSKDVSEILPYILLEYVYTQLVLRHMKCPGQSDGPPPTLHLIRKVQAEAFPDIFGCSFEENEKKESIYSSIKAFALESFSLVSPLSGDYLPRCGESAFYGQVPVYCMLCSFVSNDALGSLQKEMTVIPIADISVTAAYTFDSKKYTQEVAIPIMEKQYPDNENVKKEIEIARNKTRIAS